MLLQWIALGRVSAAVRDAGTLLVHVCATGPVFVCCCNGDGGADGVSAVAELAGGCCRELISQVQMRGTSVRLFWFSISDLVSLFRGLREEELAVAVAARCVEARCCRVGSFMVAKVSAAVDGMEVQR